MYMLCTVQFAVLAGLVTYVDTLDRLSHKNKILCILMMQLPSIWRIPKRYYRLAKVISVDFKNQLIDVDSDILIYAK